LSEIEEYAKSAAKEFFKVAGIDLEKKDHLDAKFETGVAEEFLAMNKADREKVEDLGPITAATLRKFKEQGEKPFKQITDQLKVVKETLGKAPRRNQPRVKNLEVFGRIAEALASMSHDPGLPAEVKSLAGELAGIAREHPDSHEAVKTIDNRVKEFTRAQKAARERQEPTRAT
jgi:hypothetical protein